MNFPPFSVILITNESSGSKDLEGLVSVSIEDYKITPRRTIVSVDSFDNPKLPYILFHPNTEIFWDGKEEVPLLCDYTILHPKKKIESPKKKMVILSMDLPQPTLTSLYEQCESGGIVVLPWDLDPTGPVAAVLYAREDFDLYVDQKCGTRAKYVWPTAKDWLFVEPGRQGDDVFLI